MKKKSKNIGYLFSEGVRGIFLHGFMSFAAICVTVACLVIIGSFALILYNLNLLVTDLKQQAEIVVYVDETYSQAEAKSVGSSINQIENVNQAIFRTRAEAYDAFVERQGNIEAFEGVDSENFRDRFLVTLTDNDKMDETVEQIRAVKGVADISDSREIVEGFATIQKVLKIASAAIIGVLLIVSLFVISNTIKLSMIGRRDEIAIMKMVGATNRFIRFPYVIEGFIVGLVGAMIAFFAEWGLYQLLVDQIARVDSLKLFSTIVPFTSVIWTMIATFGIAGLFVGVFGSLMSIRKFLDV